jgi:hypothetical protein
LLIPLFAIVATLVKGIELLAYQLTLVTTKVRTLREANLALSKRHRAKKNCIHQGGALAIEDAYNILA